MSNKLVYCCLAELSRALQLVFEFDNDAFADQKKHAKEIANNFDMTLAYFEWEREEEEEALKYARRGFDMLIDEDGIADFAKKYCGYAGTLICDAIRDICWQQFGFKW